MTRRIIAQTRVELLVAMRRGENMLATLAMPLGILVLFARVDVLPLAGDDPVTALVPGVLAFAVVASALVSVGIGTGFERQSGTFKRLGATPLGTSGLLVAKSATTAIVLFVQAAAILGVGAALGFRPDDAGALAAVPLVALGACAFSGIAFTLAGVLRAEANLAVANALFLVMLVLGDALVPVERMPGPLAAVARALPAQPLAESLRAALGGAAIPARAVLVLCAWAAGSVAVAVATFRWEE